MYGLLSVMSTLHFAGGTLVAMAIDNETMRAHRFVADMYRDAYFPDPEVAKVEAVLRELCARIEADEPKTLAELYPLTHAATEKINALEDDFAAAGSEIETGARESIAADFVAIAKAYGFADADIEELIAPRDW